MTKESDRHTTEVKWMDGTWNPECQNCTHFEHTYCDHPDSDHHGHWLMPFHYACQLFEDKE